MVDPLRAVACRTTKTIKSNEFIVKRCLLAPKMCGGDMCDPTNLVWFFLHERHDFERDGSFVAKGQEKMTA